MALNRLEEKRKLARAFPIDNEPYHWSNAREGWEIRAEVERELDEDVEGALRRRSEDARRERQRRLDEEAQVVRKIEQEEQGKREWAERGELPPGVEKAAD